MCLKKYFVIINLLLTLTIFSQEDCFNESFRKTCDAEKTELDSITFNDKKIYFFLVEKQFVAKRNNNCTFKGTVIISDLKVKLNRKDKQIVFQLINSKINLISFDVYSSCEAFNLSRTAVWSKEKERQLKEKLIGKFTAK